MTLPKNLTRDIIEWDIENWTYALKFWEKHLNSIENKKVGKLKCLELGGRRGGGSLWLASKGHEVICSDLTNPEEFAKELHSKYELDVKIDYQVINAIDIPYSDHFDIIVLKSIIGGVSHSGQDELQQKIIENCYNALKKGGVLYFAENLAASKFHQFMRKKFVSWGSRWNYLKYSNMDDLFSKFPQKEYKSRGFFAVFGRTENQRTILAKIDAIAHPVTPRNFRYLVYGYAQK